MNASTSIVRIIIEIKVKSKTFGLKPKQTPSKKTV